MRSALVKFPDETDFQTRSIEEIVQYAAIQKSNGLKEGGKALNGVEYQCLGGCGVAIFPSSLSSMERASHFAHNDTTNVPQFYCLMIEPRPNMKWLPHSEELDVEECLNNLSKIEVLKRLFKFCKSVEALFSEKIFVSQLNELARDKYKELRRPEWKVGYKLLVDAIYDLQQKNEKVPVILRPKQIGFSNVYQHRQKFVIVRKYLIPLDKRNKDFGNETKDFQEVHVSEKNYWAGAKNQRQNAWFSDDALEMIKDVLKRPIKFY